jgi:DNA-binding transcriptional ArsR family regulator
MDRARTDNLLAHTAAAIADPSRAAMLCQLLDGRAYTATELATLADIAASTASSHLTKLRERGLIDVVAQGKHRYFRLAGVEVARVLEGLLALANTPRRDWTPSTPRELRQARSCYDHLAGSIAVALHDRLRERGWLEIDADDYGLTATGERELAGMGLDPATLRSGRRRFAYGCLDWSERRLHLGGALGGAMLQCFVDRAWLVPQLAGRGLRVTARGRVALSQRFGIVPSENETT